MQTQKELLAALEMLRTEVDSLAQDHAPVRKRLDALISDIEGQIGDLDEAKHRAKLHRRLDKLVAQLEAGHPKITDILNRIMVTLSNMGI